jgi:hypothetical protein
LPEAIRARLAVVEARIQAKKKRLSSSSHTLRDATGRAGSPPPLPAIPPGGDGAEAGPKFVFDDRSLEKISDIKDQGFGAPMRKP